LVFEWNRKSGGRRSLQKNDDFVGNVINGRIQVRAPAKLTRIEGNTVIFDDDSTLKVDAIVFCTGYEESSIPKDWIKDVEIPDVRRLYKHAFHPDLGRRIAFFGWARPRQGGLPALSELLARYFSLLCSGERKLPEKNEMERIIIEDCAREEEWFSNSKTTRSLVHYTKYMDDLADLIECHPKLENHLNDPKLLAHLICSSNIGLSYRLHGPGAFPEIAREACVSGPIADPYVAIDKFVDCALGQKLNPDLANRIGALIRTYLTTHTTDMPSTADWEG
jgi:dimethylaniline monooxygenase (N-oxide forming)